MNITNVSEILPILIVIGARGHIKPVVRLLTNENNIFLSIV